MEAGIVDDFENTLFFYFNLKNASKKGNVEFSGSESVSPTFLKGLSISVINILKRIKGIAPWS